MIEITENLIADRDEAIIVVRCDCGWCFNLAITGFEKKNDPAGFKNRITWLERLGVAHEAGHSAERKT